MNKRFNIRAAFEEAKEAADAAQLEVDKEAALTPEEKALRDSALQLASATDESEDAKPAEDKGTTDTPPAADETPTPTEEPVFTDEVAPVAGEEPEAEEGTDADTDKAEKAEPTPEPTEEPKEGDDAEPTDAPDLDLDNPDDVPVDPESEEGKEKAKDNEEDKEQEKDAVKVAASLESIANIMQRSLDKGGLTPMSAQATALVLGQLYNRVGLTYKPAAFPAMESYGSVSSRKRNTELALEGVTQAIENVWVAIKKSIARACAKIRETARMFAYYFRTVEGQIKSIRSLLPKLSKDKTDKLYSDGKGILNLSVGQDFDPLTVIKELTFLTETVKTKLLPVAIQNLKDLLVTLKLDTNKVDIKDIPRISFDIKDFTSFAVAASKGSEVDNLYSASKLFLGRYSFEATLPKPGLDTPSFQQALLSTSVELEKVDGDDKQAVNAKPFLEVKDISSFLDKTQVLVTKMYEFWNAFSKLEGQFINIEDKLDNSSNIGAAAATYAYGKNSLGSTVIGPIVDKAIEANRDRLNSSVKKQVILSVKAIERTYIDFSLSVSDLAYKTAVCAIRYANASAKAYI